MSAHSNGAKAKVISLKVRNGQKKAQQYKEKWSLKCSAKAIFSKCQKNFRDTLKKAWEINDT